MLFNTVCRAGAARACPAEMTIVNFVSYRSQLA